MGDLKRGFMRGVRSAKKFVGDAWEGSKQIAEKLGYEKAGVTPKSDSTKQQLAAMAEPVLPVADDEELRRSRRRRISSQPRAGRASTILTSDDDTLG